MNRTDFFFIVCMKIKWFYAEAYAYNVDVNIQTNLLQMLKYDKFITYFTELKFQSRHVSFLFSTRELQTL